MNENLPSDGPKLSNRHIFLRAIELNRSSLNSAFLMFAAIIVWMLCYLALPPTLSEKLSHGAVDNLSQTNRQAIGLYYLAGAVIALFTFNTIVLDVFRRDGDRGPSFGNCLVRSLRRFGPSLLYFACVALVGAGLFFLIAKLAGVLDHYLPDGIQAITAFVVFTVTFAMGAFFQSIFAIGNTSLLIQDASLLGSFRATFKIVGNRKGAAAAVRFAATNLAFQIVPLLLNGMLFKYLISAVHSDAAKYLLSLLMLAICIWINLVAITALTLYCLQSLARAENAPPAGTV